MEPTICIYHNKDLDGFTSGAIAKLKYPDIHLVGYDYGDPIPWAQIKNAPHVLLVDISFPIDAMSLMAKKTKVTWIDHHISAYKEYTDAVLVNHELATIDYMYDQNKAACEIAWETFFPDYQTPKAIELIGSYDVWRKQGKYWWENKILPFQYGMRQICTSPTTFPAELFNPLIAIGEPSEIHDIIQIGEHIIKYQEAMDERMIQENSYEQELFELRAIVLNGIISSNTFKSVYDPKKHDIMVGWYYCGKTGIYKVSLRSDKKEIDCSEIAKIRGGGGHKGAAGFEMHNRPQ